MAAAAAAAKAEASLSDASASQPAVDHVENSVRRQRVSNLI